MVAMGTIFPTRRATRELHMHAAAGREGGATVGCVRAGVDVWLIGEVIILEIEGMEGFRKKDPKTGFQITSVFARRHKGTLFSRRAVPCPSAAKNSSGPRLRFSCAMVY